MTTTDQRTRILDHLREFGSITAMEALSLYQCMRLAARIHELRSHYKIKTEHVRVNPSVSFARYVLDVPKPLQREMFS